ncbi:MAG: MAPEG family protein [Oceanococcus sp.]
MALSIWFQLFLAFNVLLITLLAFNVSRLRIVKRVAHGDGGDISVKAAIRSHANGVEHFPVFALVLLGLEWGAAANGLIAGLVIAFSASRVSHAIGMLSRFFILRRLGASVTYLCELIAVIALLQQLIISA